jgi:hypothetical protein
VTCDACTEAERNPQTGYFRAQCLNCSARMFANSPMAWDALRGRTGPLQDAIRKTWPDDYEGGKQLVWQWVKKLKAARAAMKG